MDIIDKGVNGQIIPRKYYEVRFRGLASCPTVGFNQYKYCGILNAEFKAQP